MEEKELFDKFIITSDDILGKDVIDSKGNLIGIITKLHIDKKKKKIIGMSIDTGFLKATLFVGINLIINFGIDTVFISHTPKTKYLGLLVFDRKGDYIGKIVNVAMIDENKEIDYLIVKTKFFKKITINNKNIKLIGRNIILNDLKKEII
ncbi:MAG: PRC-barrel domain-containing protein [Candidatus Woesearchaeota archaeon]